MGSSDWLTPRIRGGFGVVGGFVRTQNPKPRVYVQKAVVTQAVSGVGFRARVLVGILNQPPNIAAIIIGF